MKDIVCALLKVVDLVAEVGFLGVVNVDDILTGGDGQGVLIDAVVVVAVDVNNFVRTRDRCVEGHTVLNLLLVKDIVCALLKVVDGIAQISALDVEDLDDILAGIGTDSQREVLGLIELVAREFLVRISADGAVERFIQGFSLGVVDFAVVVVLNGVIIGFRNPLSGVNNFIGRTADCGSDTGGPAVKSIIFALGRSIWRRRIAFLQVIKRLKNAAIGVFIGYAINLDGRLTNSAFGKFDVSAIQFAALERQADIIVGIKLADLLNAIFQLNLKAYFLLILINVPDFPGQRSIVLGQGIVLAHQLEVIRVDDVGHHSTCSRVNGIGNGLPQRGQNTAQASGAGGIVECLALAVSRGNGFKSARLIIRQGNADGHNGNAAIL